MLIKYFSADNDGLAMLDLQITPSTVNYGQVNQEAATQAKPAGIVNATTHHHHIFRFRKRTMSRRKKHRYGILTGKMTNRQSVAAALLGLETFGISSGTSRRRSNSACSII